jgi:hypothetical protein
LSSTLEPKNGPFSGNFKKWIWAILPLKNEVGKVGKKWEKPRFQIGIYFLREALHPEPAEAAPAPALHRAADETSK